MVKNQRQDKHDARMKKALCRHAVVSRYLALKPKRGLKRKLLEELSSRTWIGPDGESYQVAAETIRYACRLARVAEPSVGSYRAPQGPAPIGSVRCACHAAGEPAASWSAACRAASWWAGAEASRQPRVFSRPATAWTRKRAGANRAPALSSFQPSRQRRQVSGAHRSQAPTGVCRSRPRRRMASSRILNFCTLPVTVSGNRSTNST